MPQPKLSLDWVDEHDKKITLLLPWLKATPDPLDIAIPCDLGKIKGSELKLNAHYTDQDCSIKLGASPLAAHPIFGGGQLF